MYYIIHETNKRYIPFILKNGLITSSEANAANCFGQGCSKQVLTNDPSYMLTSWQRGTEPKYTSVDAVYFRVVKNLENIVPRYGGSAIIVLDRSCLTNKSWHFNTAENYGFYLNGESPLTDEFGTTVFSFKDIVGPNTEEGELVVMQNLGPQCIKNVFIF